MSLHPFTTSEVKISPIPPITKSTLTKTNSGDLINFLSISPVTNTSKVNIEKKVTITTEFILKGNGIEKANKSAAHKPNLLIVGEAITVSCRILICCGLLQNLVKKLFIELYQYCFLALLN